MLFAGVFAMLAARRGHEEKGDDVSLSLKCYVSNRLFVPLSAQHPFTTLFLC